MTFLFDILLLPFGTLPRLWGLLAASIATGLLTVLAFRAVSDQNAVASARRVMTGRALGMLLHLHAPAFVLKNAAALIADNFLYLWIILRPMLVIALPFLVTAAQLDARYGMSPVPHETPVAVTVEWERMPSRGEAELLGEGIAVLQPMIVSDSLMQTSFNVRSGTPGASLLAGSHRFPVGARTGASGSVLYRGAAKLSLPERLLKPFIAPLPGGNPVRRVTVHLPEAGYRVFGGRWSWLGVFIAASSLSALAGAAVFRVKV